MECLLPRALRTRDGFDIALRFLDDQLSKRSPRLSRTFEALLQRDALVERLVSKIPVYTFPSFWSYLRDQCPEDSAPEFLNSVSCKLLLRFHSVLPHHVPVPFEDLRNTVQSHSVSVAQKIDALRALEPYTELGPLDPISSLSSKTFVECGHPVPTTGREAKKLAGKLIRELMLALKSYLNILRDGRLSEAITKYYAACYPGGPDEETVQDEVQDDLTLYEPSVPRKKAAVTLDTIDRLGHVKVTVSTRFVDNMRTSRKRPRLFAKIQATVTELAQGQMEGQNGMVLAKSDEGHAIYSAFLNKHCSLVYHRSGADEVQIFGVYAADALENGNFWYAAARELAILGHGSEADSSRLPNDQIIDPELADQVRFLVVYVGAFLDRFVELSKNLIKRIQDDKDVQAMFQLSSQEEEVVEHDGSCYVLGRSGTGKTTIMLFRMINIESAWYQYGGDVGLKPRQLFLTRSQNLADRVKESFTRLHETHVIGPRSSEAFGEDPGEDRRLAGSWCADIPDSFNDLEAKHFPLFISYDKLSTMLEIALGLQTYGGNSCQDSRWSDKTLLTYDIFLKQYWDMCPVYLKRDFDPFLVYGEIIGVIKGSEETFASGRCFLNREEYLQLGSWYGTFEDHREEVYLLFLWYRKRQGQLRHVDIADRTHEILNAFSEEKPPFLRSLDFVYIDEAQDNLLIDAMIVKMLCKNSDGLLWAGDTAQTIFAGNSFTFSTLRAFLFRQDESDLAAYRARHKPEFFKLTKNFRSRGGIVACGQTILEIIACFWPSTIDQIPKEINLTCGTRPYFYIDDKDGHTMLNQLLSESNKRLEFGAEQCILVRNEEVRDSLRPHLGDSTLLLTLYESKGLEFNDVLLWNFFADSGYDRSAWTTIAHGGIQGRSLKGPPKGLAIELKFLYVATTRAKNRLLILDESAQAKIIQDIWAAQGEVETGSGSDGFDLSKFAAASSQEEWAKKGHDFFREARYKLAAQAWRMAGLHHEAAMANAFYLRDQVDLMSTAEEPLPARQNQYYVEGAGCLARIPDIPRAALTYVMGQDYNRGVRLFRSEAMFDEAIDVIRSHSVDPTLKAQVMYIAKLYYFQQARSENALKMCSSEEDALAFVDEHGLRQVKGRLVAHLALDTQAAEFQLRANRPAECLRHLRNAKAKGTGLTLRLDTDVLLGSFWREPTVSIMARKATTQTIERVSALWSVVELWREANNKVIPSHIEEQLSMFRDISSSDTLALEQHAEAFATRPSSHRAAALLCFRHLRKLQSAPAENSSPAAISVWLHIAQRHAFTIRSVLLDSGSFEQRDFQRLAGFRPVSTRDVRLLPDGLAISLVSQAKRELLTREGPQIVQKAALFPLIADHFRALLLDLAAEVAEACNATLLSTGIGGEGVTEGSTRLRCLLQLVLIDDALRGFEPAMRHMERKRSWLELFYETFTRNTLALVATLRDVIGGIPEGGVCTQILTSWIRDILKHIPDIESDRRPTVLIQVSFLCVFLDLEHIETHMIRARLVGSNSPSVWLQVYTQPAPFLDRSAQFIINDLLDATEGVRRWSLDSGVNFLRHVVRAQFILDACTLCDYIDYLIGGFIIAFCQAGNDAIVPRSSALLLLQHVITLQDQETSYIRIFLGVLGEIMRRVLVQGQGRNSNGTIRIENGPMSREQQFKIVMRICQSMGILGSAVDNYGLREDIVAVMASLHSSNARIDYPPLLRFATVNKWSQVASAVSFGVPTARLRSNLSDDGELHHTLSFGHLSGPPAGKKKDVKPVVDPVTAIVGEPVPGPPSRKKNVESFVDSAAHVAGKLGVSGPPAKKKKDAEPLVSDSAFPAAGDLEFAILRAIDEAGLFSDPPEQRILCGRLAEAMRSKMPTGEELRAIHVVKTIVRSYLVRRKGNGGLDSMAFAVNRHYSDCLKRARELRMSPTERHLLLGPLPHALACLDGLRMHFEAEKDRLGKRLQKAAHIDLDDAGADVKKAHALLSAVLELQRHLQPQSELYLQTGWVIAFRSHIERVGESVKEAKAEMAVRQDLNAEWDLVYKAVLYTGRKTWIR